MASTRSHRLEGKTQTTTLETKTLIEVSLPVNSVAHLSARVVGKSGNNMVGATRIAGFRTEATPTSTLVGSVAEPASAVDAALVGTVVTWDASGSSARLRVTGLAATTIDWDAEVEARIYQP